VQITPYYKFSLKVDNSFQRFLTRGIRPYLPEKACSYGQIDSTEMKLQNKTAFITGATKGLGRAIALAFAKEGAHIAGTGRNEEELASLKTEVEGLGVRCATVRADLSKSGEVHRVWDVLVGELGDIHILLNNAGIGSSSNPRPVECYNDAFWEMLLYVNLTVPYLLCKKALPGMMERRHGRIIQISSISGKVGAFHGAAYSASKHGLLGLSRSLAVEVAAKGITVNAICPGPVKTLINDRRVAYDAQRLGKDLKEVERTSTPLGRRLVVAEVAPLAVYLASEDSAAMTGQALNIDGGILMTG
tara:strand:+ start:8686 stop:9594 length:909 start_codon:yes stop_codon:yes gene_type:complete